MFYGLWFMVYDLWFRVQGSGFRVSVLGFMVQGELTKVSRAKRHVERARCSQAACSNYLFQIPDLYWNSPESGGSWYKSR